ncbi:hypothetical protein GUJ93_ZPchr0011g28836 [Zizania palustris]|uniref:DUF295 domain-containing protein n=1 Tax=Zizania palustris TaxID=103762 RepID=A0A8J5WJX3_ZIZPA|nr:hypothetical protein GUJ93_ZPchr0011g28836 [Zizania palustris]
MDNWSKRALVSEGTSAHSLAPRDPPAAMDSGTISSGGKLEGPSWADIPCDIIGILLARLPTVEDRARLRSVCSAWRAAARAHRPPPPLPLLVFFNFAFSWFRPDGSMSETRRIRLPVEVAAGDVRCVGSSGGWLVGVRQKRPFFGDDACFLVNAFSQEVVRLPPPSASTSTHHVDAYSTSLPIINGSGVVDCTIHAARYVMSFWKVILSSSPDSGSNYTVAALSGHRNGPKLALWRPGMTSWCVCHGGCISKFSDVVFYQGKLYMFSKVTTNLFSFEITENDHGVMVSRVEMCVIELPQLKHTFGLMWVMLEWHGKLLFVVRYLDGSEIFESFMLKVCLFVVDSSTTPFRFTEINSLDGDCIFIAPCNSMSFPVCQYDGIEDGLVYFMDFYRFVKSSYPIDKIVYNMRDGTMTTFAANISYDNFEVPNSRLMRPTWLFPSK